MEERRQSRRAAPAQEVNITIGGNRSARLVDVSSDGAHLELASALNPRGEYRLSLPLPDGMVRIKARVVHCKLTALNPKGGKGQLVYRAGIQFLDLDPKLAASIEIAYPPPVTRPVRTGPIKVKINIDALERAAELNKHGAN